MADAATYGVRLLHMGDGEVPGPEVFWMSDWDQWYTLAFQAVLIEGPGVKALVNTGPAEDLTAMNEQWATFLGERAAMKRGPGQWMPEQLEALGIAPAEITHVLLTHHHYDHVVGVRALADRFGAPVWAHEQTDQLIDDKVDQTFTDGDTIETGALRVEVIHTPGHCADHCALAFNGSKGPFEPLVVRHLSNCQNLFGENASNCLQ